VKPNSQGLQEVQSDFKLVTVDAVTDPSGMGCYVNGILEDRDFFYDSIKETWMEKQAEDIHKELRKMTAKDAVHHTIKLLESVWSGSNSQFK
jgi:hypothetical protein